MRYYILMADIVDSRKQDSTLLLERFQNMVLAVNTHWSEFLIIPLKISLGDEFQGVVTSLGVATDLIMDIEERLLEFDLAIRLRYVLHYGTIDTNLQMAKSSVMMGNGLATARESLNQLKNDEPRFLFSSEVEPRTKLDLLNKAFSWYQSIVDHWKTNDRQWLRLFLANKDYKEIADIFAKPRSTAWRRNKSLNIEGYIKAKSLINGIATIV